jgi:CheY-like chemotaxis protein
MTNKAISSILAYFYSEALKQNGSAGADQLLRSINDIQDLLSSAPRRPAGTEEFDMVPCAGAIVDVLNLASTKRVKQMVMEEPPQSLLVTQDRRAVEKMLTRVLNSALKLAQGNASPLKLRIAGGKTSVKLAITISEEALAYRLSNWLNADPETALLQDPGDLPFGIALMVAGKQLRAMGGAANFDGESTVTLEVPSYARGAGPDHQKVRPDALNVLVAEDNDESFVLTEMVLQDEHVWRARDGQEALRMIQKQRFDVVFMDIHMPGMNGYETIHSMRDWETRTGSVRTPMVVLSSDDLETQKRFAAEFGCSGFLRKPLQKADLMPLLERLK